MRILHVSSAIDPRIGGTTAAVAGMATAQRQVGLDVTVVATHSRDFDDRTVQQLEGADVRVRTIGPTRTPLHLHRHIGPVLTEHIQQADVVHIHALWEQIQHRAARVAERENTPYLVSPHGMLDPWSLSQSRLKKRLYMAWRLRRNLNRSTALHFTTQTEQRLVEPLGLRAPGFVEPLGLDLSEFDPLPEPGSFRRQWPKVGDRPFVLFLSRLHPKKGLELLIPAFAQGAPEEAMLVLAGPGEAEYQRQLEALAAEQGIGERTVFTGMLYERDRVAALADANLFALPSYQENFGIVVPEALAAGTPVVISDQVNIHSEITEAQVGQVVPTEVPPLARALADWLSDEPKRAAAAERARPVAWQRYDWPAIARRWVERYERLNRDAGGSRMEM